MFKLVEPDGVPLPGFSGGSQIIVLVDDGKAVLRCSLVTERQARLRVLSTATVQADDRLLRRHVKRHPELPHCVMHRPRLVAPADELEEQMRRVTLPRYSYRQI